MSDVECPVGKRFKFESDECNQGTLGQFVVIDQVQDDENASEFVDCEEDSSDTNLNDVEIENMLNDRLPDELKNRKTDAEFNEIFKTVLEEKIQNYFEVLPEGWLKVIHNSGMPVYLHNQTRVCTVSPPYFIGPGSVRRHRIPITAIPCLGYKTALEKEAQLAKSGTNLENEFNEADSSSCGRFEGSKPNVVIETMEDILEKQSLSPEQITEYCKKLFLFKRIRLLRFRSWRANRKYAQRKKNIKYLQQPPLIEGTKLISFAINNTDGQNKYSRCIRDKIMNPNGKSFLNILQEYVQSVFKKPAIFEFTENENGSTTPYSATVLIDNLKYGTGFASNKKEAKRQAARKTLEILIPEMRDKFTSDKNKFTEEKLDKKTSIFDEIAIKDPRVTEFCRITTEPLPHAVLMTCLQRNFRLGEVKMDYRVTNKRKGNELTMTVGMHEVNIVCKNKSEGIHKASQAMLQTLHPHIQTWGSLLRLYGNHSAKENKRAEKEIIALQGKAGIKQPNYAMLEKLQLEMLKIKGSREANKPIGTLVPSSIEDLQLKSNLDLNNVLL